MPRCKEAAAGLSEYSMHRVQSLLDDLTAWHKNVCVGYRTAASTRTTVTDV